MGKPSINGPFSIAMLIHQRVTFWGFLVGLQVLHLNKFQCPKYHWATPQASSTVCLSSASAVLDLDVLPRDHTIGPLPSSQDSPKLFVGSSYWCLLVPRISPYIPIFHDVSLAHGVNIDASSALSLSLFWLMAILSVMTCHANFRWLMVKWQRTPPQKPY